ncbi:hypothetical protein [Streptomyces sp. NPDC002104]
MNQNTATATATATATESASSARSAPTTAPDRVTRPTAAPGEPHGLFPPGVFRFSVPAGGRAHHREDYAAIR